MAYEERVAWSGLITSILVLIAYPLLLLWSPDPHGSWLPIMLYTIGGGVFVTVLITTLWGVIAARHDPDARTMSDVRDKDIARMGTRVEHAFLVIAGLAVIVLCAMNVDVFWIAQTMFAGFAVSALIGTIARVVAYRRGLV